VVVQTEDAELMEIGATIKSFQTVRIISIQLVSAQIVAKWLIAMLPLQMQEIVLLVCWFLTTQLNIVMMEIFVLLICAIPTQPVQVLVIMSLTLKQSSKRLSVPDTALVKPSVVWQTVVFTPQSIAISPVFALIMFVMQQPTTLVLQ